MWVCVCIYVYENKYVDTYKNVVTDQEYGGCCIDSEKRKKQFHCTVCYHVLCPASHRAKWYPKCIDFWKICCFHFFFLSKKIILIRLLVFIIYSMFRSTWSEWMMKTHWFYTVVRASGWSQVTAGFVLFGIIFFFPFLQICRYLVSPSNFIELALNPVLGPGQSYCNSCSLCYWVAKSNKFGLTEYMCAQLLSHPFLLNLVEHTVCWLCWVAELF